jgi:HD-GYP domain-containing protein (c-di-GMP phosphodiesterase class II)
MDFAEKLAKRIHEQIAKVRVMDIGISVSIGWDTKNSPDQNTEEIIKRAEDAMYRKKIFNTTSKRNGIVQSIMNSLLVKNPREEAHSKRVSNICAEIGRAYELSDDEIKELKVIGELHDIGKIAIDEAILNKEGSLSESERAQIQKHPETGYRLLGTSNEFTNIAEFILAHHERWDGKGYPRGLKGDEIPWKARIIAIADAYDAMTCDRPYRKALSKEDAMAELIKNAGTQFDVDIVQIFVNKVVAKL